MKTSTVLKRALRLLDGGRKWGKGQMFLETEEVTQYCSIGAINEVLIGREYNEQRRLIYSSIFRLARAIESFNREYPTPSASVISWNDAPTRRWPHVEAAFKRAIQRAEKQESKR